MLWQFIKWTYFSFGVSLYGQWALCTSPVLCFARVFLKVLEKPLTANKVTLARSCITPCPARHSCSSCHFLPLTTWLWLWTASVFCISQTNYVLNVFICEGFHCMLWICTEARGFLFCVIMCWFVALFYFLFHPPPPLSSTWNIKLNVT